MMRLFSALLFLFQTYFVCAQHYPYKWSLGIHTGFSTYYGDLTPYTFRTDGVWKTMGHLYTFNPNYFNGPSWQISLNRVLNNTVSLKLGTSQITFSANDRFIKPNGVLWTESPNFDRGLNVKTEINDLFAGLVFRTDNGRLLPFRSIIAPYFGISALLLRFQSFADLKDDEGNFYNLTSTQTRQNGVYETSLQELRTEGVEYSNLVAGIRLDLGIRIRLSGQISMLLSSQWTMPFTDYLDDVSGTYPSSFPDQLTQRASDPTDRRFITAQRGNNQPYDFYLFHSVGLQWSFGTRKSLTRFPIAGGFAAPPSAQSKASKFDPLIKNQDNIRPLDTNSLIEIEQQKRSIQSLEHRLDLLTQSYHIIHARLLVKENESKQSDLKKLTDQLSDSINYLNDLLREVDIDTILPKQMRDSLSHFILTRKNIHKKSLDSLDEYRKKLIAESDSLSTWLSMNNDLMARSFSEQIQAISNSREKVMTPNSPTPETAVQTKPQMIEIEEKTKSIESIIQHTDTIVEDSTLNIRNDEDPVDTQDAKTKKISTNNKKSDLNSEIVRPIRATTIAPNYPSRGPVRTTSQSYKQRKEIPNAIKSTSETTSLTDRTPDVIIPSKEINAEPMSETRVKTTAVSQTDTLFYSRIVTILDQQSEALKILVNELKELQNYRQRSEHLSSDTSTSYDRNIPPIDSTIFGQEIPVPKFADFKRKITFFFEKGKSLPDSSDIQLLRQIGKFLADSTESFIVITGFADNTGSIETNLELINSRMENIRNILIDEGVNPVRIRMEVGGIVVRGRPKANSTDRRVDITFFW